MRLAGPSGKTDQGADCRPKPAYGDGRSFNAAGRRRAPVCGGVIGRILGTAQRSGAIKQPRPRQWPAGQRGPGCPRPCRRSEPYCFRFRDLELKKRSAEFELAQGRSIADGECSGRVCPAFPLLRLSRGRRGCFLGVSQARRRFRHGLTNAAQNLLASDRESGGGWSADIAQQQCPSPGFCWRLALLMKLNSLGYKDAPGRPSGRSPPGSPILLCGLGLG